MVNKTYLENRWQPAAKIVSIYVIVGALWILASDQVLAFLVHDAEIITQLQTKKGWLFIFATATLLFWLVQRQFVSLLEKEKYNRVLFEESTIGLALCRMNGELVDVNTAYAQIIGRGVEETLQFNYWDITPEKYAEDEQRQLESLDTIGHYGPYEKEYIHKDGHLVQVRLSGMILEQEGERFIWSSVEDITEHKRAEERIRKSEASLAEAQSMAHIGSWELDLVTNQLGWSDEICRIFEIDPHKFGASYDAFLAAIHPDDRERVNTAYTESVKNKTPYSIEHRLRLPDGTIKHVQECCETFYDNEGNSIRSVGTVQDLTERYLTEQSLKRLNRSLRVLCACNEVLVRAEDETELLDKICHMIVDISGYRMAWVGFVEHDETKTIRPVSEAGYDDGYLNTVKLTWADTERGRGPAGTAVRTGKPCIIRDVRSDSRFVPWRQQAIEHGYASVVGLPLVEDQKSFGVLLVYASEANSFDEQEVRLLQKLADDLAFGLMTLRSNQERHKLNRQLQQAQKMEAIGQLTGGIAHDFNNILASILGFSSLALQRFVSDDQPELREYLNEVVHAGERARDLVSQMLVFSRTDGRNASLLQLPPMIKELTKMLQATLPSSIQLSNQIDANVPSVMMDPVHLQQVLMNLCINARDAIGDKGRIDIQVHRVHDGEVLRPICDACQNEIKEGDYVEISVQDTGAGMEDDQLKRIFEPFFTTKDVGKGTGMGLSMVHGIVHQHGGHILVDTQPGIGTTFRLLLPVGEDMPIQKIDAELDKGSITEELKGARLLIVDDEESVVRFMGDLFENCGGHVTVMTDSQAALDLFSQDPTAFDLVITDQTMPQLTGVELAKKLMMLAPELPIILCTGYSEQVDESRAKKMGISGYLSKPMESHLLLKLAAELIHKRTGNNAHAT